MKTTQRITSVAGLTVAVAAGAMLTAATASAHVTVHSTDAVQGGYSVLTFRVPTESATASTTKLAVTLPSNEPIASVSVQPHPGWSFHVKMSKLNPPITTEDGQVTEAVTEIDWQADSPATAIKPGEFDQFNVSAGPLPKVASMTFRAIQTYSDGSIVKWIEVPAPGSTNEPDHPAPVLTLSAAAKSGTNSAALSTSSTGANNDASRPSSDSDTESIVGIALGAVALALAAGALVLTLRRRRA